MSLKKVMSSIGLVSTEREGGSTLWLVKGRLVSTVIVAVESDDRRRVAHTAADNGFMMWLMARLVDRAIFRSVLSESVKRKKKQRGESLVRC